MPDEYNSSYTGEQIDSAVGKALSPDSTPTAGSQNLITSGAVKSALTLRESDLASIHATGTTNATGNTITSGTFFYLNNALVVAKTDIANGATFTLNTNYGVPTAGALNALKSALELEYIGHAYSGSNVTFNLNDYSEIVIFAYYQSVDALDTLQVGAIPIALFNTARGWPIGYFINTNNYRTVYANTSASGGVGIVQWGAEWHGSALTGGFYDLLVYGRKA